MRVVHLVTRSHLRGAELSALDLADELDVLGHESHVVALAPGFDGTVEPRLPVLIDDVRLGPSALPRHVVALARTLRQHNPDVVLAHGGTAARVAALVPRRLRPPVVWQRILQFPDQVFRVPHRFMWQLVASRVDAGIALTPRNAAELVRLGFRGPVWEIPNSRRAARFAEVDRTENAVRLRDEVGVGGDVALLGLVGHLVEQKRPERAVAVLRGVRDAGIDAHLVVVGGGPLREAVAEAVAEADLTEHVSMLGVRRDVPDVLAGLDVLLATSDAEGIPGVMIEASMVGCPVVTFPFDGAQALAHGGLAVLDRADVPTMAATVESLLDDRERLAKMGEEARQAAPVLATEMVARQYADRLTEVLQSAGSTSRARIALLR